MSAIMLDCEKATLYATKSEFQSLGCVRRVQLKIHLVTCEFCRSFVQQSKIITKQLHVMKDIDPENLELHLTQKQKEDLRETVESHLENK